MVSNFLSIVSGDMRLQPNIGSDRSWVWKVAADYSEQPPTAETLAIRFANADSKSYYQPHDILWKSI
jgi:Ran-binding protein 1